MSKFRCNVLYKEGTQALYSDIFGLHPARVTHLHHCLSVWMDATPFKVPVQRI